MKLAVAQQLCRHKGNGAYLLSSKLPSLLLVLRLACCSMLACPRVQTDAAEQNLPWLRCSSALTNDHVLNQEICIQSCVVHCITLDQLWRLLVQAASLTNARGPCICANVWSC